jgi:hypothetical protein
MVHRTQTPAAAPSKKSWPADYVLQLIAACFAAGLPQDQASEKVKAACQAGTTVEAFRKELNLPCSSR